MHLRLDNKTALVTGGSRGIGRAIAAALADAGAEVMIVSRKPDQLERTADDLNATGPSNPDGTRRGRVDWVVANAGDEAESVAAVEKTIERKGSIDVLVNNAATNPYLGPLVGINGSQASKTVQVNQWGYLRWVQLVHAAWMAEHGGVVCNIASVGGITVEENIGYYNATKAAVLHLTKQLAAELGPTIRVNAVAPGLIRTDMARALWEAEEARLVMKWPLRRLGEPEDVANAVLFLCSDAAAYVTGTALVVDGGATAGPSLT